MMRASVTAAIIALLPAVLHGWTAVPSSTRRHVKLIERGPSSFVCTPSDCSSRTSQCLAPSSSLVDSSLLLAEESWRQYVPLAVSALVIIDILLGSPVLNLIVAPMKRQAEGQDESSDAGGGMFASTTSQPRVNPKERIDSEQVAQEALDRARNSMELREYLEAQKTDWDRMEEIRKKMDEEMAELDETLEKRKQKD